MPVAPVIDILQICSINFKNIKKNTLSLSGPSLISIDALIWVNFHPKNIHSLS